MKPSDIVVNRPVILPVKNKTGRFDEILLGDCSVFHTEQDSKKKKLNFKQKSS